MMPFFASTGIITEFDFEIKTSVDPQLTAMTLSSSTVLQICSWGCLPILSLVPITISTRRRSHRPAESTTSIWPTGWTSCCGTGRVFLLS